MVKSSASDCRFDEYVGWKVTIIGSDRKLALDFERHFGFCVDADAVELDAVDPFRTPRRDRQRRVAVQFQCRSIGGSWVNILQLDGELVYGVDQACGGLVPCSVVNVLPLSICLDSQSLAPQANSINDAPRASPILVIRVRMRNIVQDDSRDQCASRSSSASSPESVVSFDEALLPALGSCAAVSVVASQPVPPMPQHSTNS